MPQLRDIPSEQAIHFDPKVEEGRYFIIQTIQTPYSALIKQSNSHKRAVLDYLRKVHFKPLVNL